MTREEMINLTEFVAVVCPQQKINRASAVAWFEVIGHLDFETARNAVIAAKHSQAFVDPSDIIREAKRAESAKPCERTAADAMAASSLRELDATPAVPPTPEYLAAKAEWEAKSRRRREQGLLTDREAERRATDWLEYKLGGKLPPQLPLSGAPSPRWTPLPGDPPELQHWLARQAAKDGDVRPEDEPGAGT